MRPQVAALFLHVLLAGCLDSGPVQEAEHRFGGAFTNATTQEQMDEFSQKMVAHGGQVAILESFPPQFTVDDFGLNACKDAQAEAKTLTYVASARDCRAVAPSARPDEAISTTAG